ncbi:MAG: RagB/SusD family nutrient uptake outer membrane protein, partial [Hymenobacter sp.]
MKKLVTSALLAATLLGATSCKDFLTEKPVSGVAPAQITSADLYINGALNTIIGETMFRYGPFPNLWDYDNDDATGATWAFGDIGSGNFQNYWGADNGWNGPYILINHCSFAMARVQALSIDAVAQKDAVAQLRFLRAWGYY